MVEQSYTIQITLLYHKFIQELSRLYVRRPLDRLANNFNNWVQQSWIQYRDSFPRQRNKAIVKGLSSSVATVRDDERAMEKAIAVSSIRGTKFIRSIEKKRANFAWLNCGSGV